MKKIIKNKNGFTMVELLATILILALVVGISTFTIASVIKNSKEENYKLLITSIKDASEIYEQECKYSNNTGISCGSTITLNELLTYGYLKGNDKNKSKIINPKTEEDIGYCEIKITLSNGSINISDATGNEKCPTY